MFEQATLQILEDMERTLAGDAPILVGNWTAKVRFSGDYGDEYVACGCLMMDNHVEEYSTSGYSSELHFLEELYGIESNIIGDLADEYDTWAKTYENSVRKYRMVFAPFNDRKVLKDEYRAELLEVVRAEIKARA